MPGDDGAVGLDTAVAVSGGGHRAALFGLGALLALAQTKVNTRVTSIASVSGGSLTNAAIATRLDYRQVDYEKVKGEVAAIGRCIASPPVTKSRLASLVVLVVAVALLALPWWLTPADLGVEWAWIEQHLDLTRVLIVAAGTLLTGVLLRVLVTGGGPLFGWWGTWVYLASLVALVELVFAGIPRLDGVSHVLLYVVGVLLILTLFAWRGGLTAWAFGSMLFNSKTVRARSSPTSTAPLTTSSAPPTCTPASTSTLPPGSSTPTGSGWGTQGRCRCGRPCRPRPRSPAPFPCAGSRVASASSRWARPSSTPHGSSRWSTAGCTTTWATSGRRCSPRALGTSSGPKP
jgi:hypothetical protein